MGYRITYEGFSKKQRSAKNPPLRIYGLVAAFLILFILLTCTFWPEGKMKLRQILIPGDPDITEKAVSELIVDLRSGDPITDAVSTFCREIIEHAEDSD